MRKAAVVGSEKQLTGCFREPEVPSQKHPKVAKLEEEWFIHSPGPSTMATAPMKKRISANYRYVVSP